MNCPNCGVPLGDDAVFCSACGTQIRRIKIPGRIPECDSSNEPSSQEETTTVESASKKSRFIIGAILAAILIVFILFNQQCRVEGCTNWKLNGYHYCSSHKCMVSSCDSQRIAYSNYCRAHTLLSANTTAPAVSPTKLLLHVSIVNSNSSYTYAEGTITNKSDRTVKYVEIKGSFVNRSGAVVDTDWTYAVGSEGLAPGESSKWRMSVKKDSSIKSCTVSLLDYDY